MRSVHPQCPTHAISKFIFIKNGIITNKMTIIDMYNHNYVFFYIVMISLAFLIVL